MLSLYRGLLAGFLVAGLAALCSAPSELAAQDKDKKDAKDKDKDKEKDELKDRLVGFNTSDGLSLTGYWFQGVGIEKQAPDAVMMFPAQGNKVTDAWIKLAKALSEKNFSVLLFDWRGCGLNSVAGAGSRIFDAKDKFWEEAYNGKLLMSRKATLEDKGLDWKTFPTKYREFMLNDLMAARFYLDKQNDAGKCNTNRVWIVSEKDGAHLGLAFIAGEFQRNSVFKPNKTIVDIDNQFKSAGKDYAGIMALSYAGTNPAASTIYRNALPSTGANKLVKEAKDHLEDRLALVLMYSKKDGAGASKSLAASMGVGGSDDDMKKKFKYLKEFDIKVAKPISGIDLIDPMDSFGVLDYVVKAMVGISRAQPGSKERTDREAAKITKVPRFNVEQFIK